MWDVRCKMEDVRMAVIRMAMKSTWNSPTQKCHATGRNFRKSTLQNVTKSTRNMNIGRMALKMGSKKSAAVSNCGVKAKIR